MSQLERSEVHESNGFASLAKSASIAIDGWQNNDLFSGKTAIEKQTSKQIQEQGFIDFDDASLQLASIGRFSESQKKKPAEKSKPQSNEPGHGGDGDKEKEKPEAGGEVIIMGGAGGAPPPGGGGGHERFADPNYDPEYGTVDEFVRQHRIDPKAPSKETEKKESPEKELEKKIKESPELKDVLKRLEQTLLSMDLVKDGKISPEKGKEAVDKIRESLRSFTKDINGKNIAFAVVEVNGEQKIVIGISGSNTPGAQVAEKPVLQIKRHGNMPRETDSEFKILDQIVVELKNSQLSKNSHGNIAIFTEQKPCESCDPVISTQVPKVLKDMGLPNINPPGKATWIYENEQERLAANRRKAK